MISCTLNCGTKIFEIFEFWHSKDQKTITNNNKRSSKVIIICILASEININVYGILLIQKLNTNVDSVNKLNLCLGCK